MRWFLLTAVCLSTPAAAQHVVAVVPFEANTANPELKPLGRGLVDMLTTDLSEAEAVTVVERARLDAVLAELSLQQTGYIDPKSAAALGRGLGATEVLTGGITTAKGQMRLDARIIDVASGQVVQSVEREGTVGEFFSLERALALAVLESLDVPMTTAHRRRLGEAAEASQQDTLAYAAKLARGEARARDGRDPQGPTLTVARKGLPRFSGAHEVWIDGESLGNVTLKRPVSVRLKPGAHELALTFYDGLVVDCAGVIDLPDDGLDLNTAGICRNLPNGSAPYGTALRGARASLYVRGEAFSDVEVDGTRITIRGANEMEAMQMDLNLTPGQHAVAVSHLGPEGHSVFCQGTVSVEPGVTARLMVSPQGCDGFDPGRRSPKQKPKGP